MFTATTTTTSMSNNTPLKSSTKTTTATGSLTPTAASSPTASSSSENISNEDDDLKLIDRFIGDGQIDAEYRCTVCAKIMLDVSQADDCGCRYCSDCLDHIIAKGVCAQCNRKVTSSKIPDNFLRRRIRNTVVRCQARACEWSGKLEDMFAAHYKTHKNEEQVFKCPHCFLLLQTKAQLEKHLHKENGDCKKQPVECPFKYIGCDKIETISDSDGGERGDDEDSSTTSELDNAESMETDTTGTATKTVRTLTRETLDFHLNQNINYHLRLLMEHNNSVLREHEVKLNALKSIQSQQAPTTTTTSIGYAQDLKAASATDFNFATTPTATQDTSTSSPVASKKQPLVVTAAATTMATTADVEARLQTTNSRIDMLQNNHQQMLNDVTRMHKAIDNGKLDSRMLKENLRECKQMAQELHKTLALNQVSILALEERLINLEKISYDGTLLWRITNVSERIQEAKSGRQTSFYSPPFYTGRNGYKMCVRVYLNGDGNGRNTHLSLFFVILRGEFDALLRWPFRQKVSFILIDQSSSESRENVYDAFRPDPNSSSFRRPTSDMNIASGLPVFCPLAKLTASSDHEYVKDNTMFIKTIVDVSDLPSI